MRLFTKTIYIMKEFKNLAEREILRDAAMGTHVAECFNRMTFVIGICDKEFVGRDGKVVFQPGKRYKFWLVQHYQDNVIGATVDLTVTPKRIDPNEPGKLYWNAVPIGTFKEYIPTEFWEDINSESGEKQRFQLICDNEGNQILVPDWHLEKREIAKYLDKTDKGVYGGRYDIMPRILGNERGAVFGWEIRCRMCRKSGWLYRIFDIVSGELTGYNYKEKPITTLTPISQNARSLERKNIKIRYKEKKLIFKIEGRLLNEAYFKKRKELEQQAV